MKCHGDDNFESDSSDNESLQEMEEKLVRMIEQRLKRKRGHDSLE